VLTVTGGELNSSIENTDAEKEIEKHIPELPIDYLD
jgi:hypothetical protein